ncbi:MAG: HAMP domain-containing histidine kinase [Ruminococcus sp.]|nr:HAMP domain-containing histidine kinase [Ruminococcus sp.]
MRKSCREITEKLDMIMNGDTNNIIAVTSGDKQIKQLASELNKKLRQIRKQQLRYQSGDRELKDAITNVSHDIRTPLTAIMGYLEIMKDIPKSEKLSQYLAIIQGRAEAMKTLTEELFRYSVVLSGENVSVQQTVINKLLEDSIMGAFGALTEKGITPKIDITETKIVRTLDPNALSRVFSNLLSNALKYSSGELEITLREPCVITFSNQADELTQTQVEKLFDRFYTVESAHKSTGLGLSIARTLVEQMGGTITASLDKTILTITMIL